MAARTLSGSTPNDIPPTAGCKWSVFVMPNIMMISTLWSPRRAPKTNWSKQSNRACDSHRTGDPFQMAKVNQPRAFGPKFAMSHKQTHVCIVYLQYHNPSITLAPLMRHPGIRALDIPTIFA